jgi:hypothetical protein
MTQETLYTMIHALSLGPFAACFLSCLLWTQPNVAQDQTPDSASEIVTQAIEAREALRSGRITFKEIVGTTAKTETKIKVVFDESGIRTERTTAGSASSGAPVAESRQGWIRNGSLWTQYSGNGNDPANWRVHSEVFDPSEDSEATATSYDPRLFRTGTIPRTWAPRTRVRELMSFPSVLLGDPIVAQTPTGDWLVAGRRRRPIDAELVFEIDPRRDWSLISIQLTRRAPLADGSQERWVHKAAIEPAQFESVWFPEKYVWTKEIDGKLKQRCELLTIDAEFNIEIDPLELTLKGINGLPAGVKVTRNFEGSETRIWNGSKLIEPGARP